MAGKILALVIGIFSQTLQAASLPDDFEAHYEVEKYSTTIAEMTLSLSRQGQDIIYQSRTRPRGLLAMISNDKIDETSRLKQTDDGSLQLLSYHYNRKDRPKDRQQYELHWQDATTLKISGEYHHKTVQLEADTKVWDGLSIQLALMADISPDAVFNSQYDYTIVDDGQLKHYQFEYLSRETLRIGSKSYQTLKIRRQHDKKGKRISYFWLATELNNLPVKIEQYKKGELNLTMQLTKFKQKKDD